MQKEVFSTDTIELPQPPLREAPEVLDAVHMVALPVRVLKVSMVDAVVLVAIEDEPVVGLPGIGVDRRSLLDQTLHDRHQLALSRILDDLGVDPSMTLENPEDGDLVGASPSLVIPPFPEVALIELDLPLHLPVDRLLIRENLLSEELVVPVHRVAVESGDGGCLCGREILAKASDKLFQTVIADFLVRDHEKRLGRKILLV